MSMEIWFHGTDEDGAKSILEEKSFREGTYFAKHMEQAIKFGGPCVFWVKVDWGRESLDGWQQVSANRIPTKAMVGFWETSGWFEETA